ncbi:MAG TPA: hypothetical protein VH063_04700 [Gaiellaceae bacterium]|nr:hypothetical protein [Gaiellaceae bacterium]
MFTIAYRLLFFAARSRRGRRLLVLGALSAMRLARNPRARMAYAQAWRIATNPRTRKQAGTLVRSAASRVRR